jgi:uncharacterized protein (UPF0332 family)
MSSKHSSEVEANIERAEQSVNAARKLVSDGYYDFAASRAYYAVFYAASALLLQEILGVKSTFDSLSEVSEINGAMS